MALITLEANKRTYGDSAQVKEFLEQRGVTYESWAIPSAVATLAKKELLNDHEKDQVAAAYDGELRRLRLSKGYIQNDVVCLCPTTPQITQLLSKFDREHYHSDDEVRFIFGGRGIFGFVGTSGERFTVEVGAGDYLSVPALQWHWFTLGENRNIKALRLFQDAAGWKPYYRETPTQTAGRRS